MKQILIEKYIEPSETTNIDDSLFIERWLDRNYDLQSFFGQSAVVEYYNGKVRCKSWYKKGVLHREKNLPVKIYYHENQTTWREEWYKNRILIN